MSTYTSKAAKKNRRTVFGIPMVIAMPLALILSVGAAWAAIAFTMTGSATAEADNGTTPTISGEHFTGKLYPGAQVNLKFTVTNPNPFPVKVTKVAATGASNFTGGCAGGANLSGAATQLNQDVPVSKVVPANGTAVVELENAVKLADAATAGCSFKVDFKVTGSGSAGSGN